MFLKIAALLLLSVAPRGNAGPSQVDTNCTLEFLADDTPDHLTGTPVTTITEGTSIVDLRATITAAATGSNGLWMEGNLANCGKIFLEEFVDSLGGNVACGNASGVWDAVVQNKDGDVAPVGRFIYDETTNAGVDSSTWSVGLYGFRTRFTPGGCSLGSGSNKDMLKGCSGQCVNIEVVAGEECPRLGECVSACQDACDTDAPCRNCCQCKCKCCLFTSWADIVGGECKKDEENCIPPDNCYEESPSGDRPICLVGTPGVKAECEPA